MVRFVWFPPPCVGPSVDWMCVCVCICVSVCVVVVGVLSSFVAFRCSKKAFITLCSPVVPLLSTSKADSGLASEFRRDRAIYTAYERMLKLRREKPASSINCNTSKQTWGAHLYSQFDSTSLITFAIVISYCSSLQAWESLYARRWPSGQTMKIRRGEKVIETLFFPSQTWTFPIGIKFFKTFC